MGASDNDYDDFFPDPKAAAASGDHEGGAGISSSMDYGADFQLPLPPLADEDAEFLRAVAARAAASSSSSSGSRPVLRRLIAAYDAEAAERKMQRGLAPVYQGYLLRISDGVSVDELVSGSKDDGGRSAEGKRRSEKL